MRALVDFDISRNKDEPYSDKKDILCDAHVKNLNDFDSCFAPHISATLAF